MECAARLGSPLLGVLTIADTAGNELAKAEAGTGSAVDPSLRFAAPADGLYFATVQDRFRSRGGPDFAYRLRMARPEHGFDLSFQTLGVTVRRRPTVSPAAHPGPPPRLVYRTHRPDHRRAAVRRVGPKGDRDPGRSVAGGRAAQGGGNRQGSRGHTSGPRDRDAVARPVLGDVRPGDSDGHLDRGLVGGSGPAGGRGPDAVQDHRRLRDEAHPARDRPHARSTGSSATASPAPSRSTSPTSRPGTSKG